MKTFLGGEGTLVEICVPCLVNLLSRVWMLLEKTWLRDGLLAGTLSFLDSLRLTNGPC